VRLSGALAMAGTLAGSQFSDVFHSLDPNKTPEETSLLLIWQTGVALLLGLQLWMGDKWRSARHFHKIADWNVARTFLNGRVAASTAMNKMSLAWAGPTADERDGAGGRPGYGCPMGKGDPLGV
jgi:hypothetical protein